MRSYIIFASLLALALAAPQGYGYNPHNAGQQNHRGGDKYLPPATPIQAPIIHKQFIVIGAQEDHDSIEQSKHLVIGRPQKNYRVVFIKSPGGDNANVKLSAEYAPQEEKTVIYVLTKKDNGLDVNDIATPAPTLPSKPEVYFIKYKTPEEAQSAQKEIQDQYDRLGGTNEYLDQGTAPVTSVVGSLDGAAPDGGYAYQQIQGGESSPLSNYLPPIRRI